MALTLPYPTYTPFTAPTVHSYTAHNTPHAGLLSNDQYLASQIDATNSTVSGISSTISTGLGYIETILINSQSSTGTYPNKTRSRTFDYTYTGVYIPISILVTFVIYAGGNANKNQQVKWKNSAAADMTSYVNIVGLNPFSGNDGGAALNDSFSASIPFILGSKTISFYDQYGAFGGISWLVLTLTYQKLTRPAAWGY